MPFSRPLGAIIAILLLGGCAQGVSGIVLDASTDRPLGGAIVELRNVGWGTRNGQIVWDAEKVARASTDAGGRFVFGENGGVGLRIRAHHDLAVDTSLCAYSPMVVRVGGPYPGLRADQRLLLDVAGVGERAAAARHGVSASRRSGDDESKLRIEAKGGVRFVEGTGAVPVPPALPHAGAADLDLGSACGWLFVSDGATPIAAIQIGAFGWEQDPGGPRRLVMLYAPLPKR